MSEQTDALREAIAELDAEIAEVKQKLQAGPSAEDARALAAQLAASLAERARLQAQLDNLEPADTQVSSATTSSD